MRRMCTASRDMFSLLSVKQTKVYRSDTRSKFDLIQVFIYIRLNTVAGGSDTTQLHTPALRGILKVTIKKISVNWRHGRRAYYSTCWGQVPVRLVSMYHVDTVQARRFSLTSITLQGRIHTISKEWVGGGGGVTTQAT